MKNKRWIQWTLAIWAAWVACAILWVAACGSNSNDTDLLRQQVISDGAHGGNPSFFFLPPLVKNPDFNGKFDAGLNPWVEICEWDGDNCFDPPVAKFDTTTGAGSETVRVGAEGQHYIVNWHTQRFDLDYEKVYRIKVFVENNQLGHLDVTPVRFGNEKRIVVQNGFIPVKATVPIKFRIIKSDAENLAPSWTQFEPSECTQPFCSCEFKQTDSAWQCDLLPMASLSYSLEATDENPKDNLSLEEQCQMLDTETGQTQACDNLARWQTSWSFGNPATGSFDWLTPFAPNTLRFELTFRVGDDHPIDPQYSSDIKIWIQYQ